MVFVNANIDDKPAIHNESVSEIDWNILSLGKYIPEPPSKRIEIHDNTEKELYIGINDIEENDYYTYRGEVKKLGYTSEKNENSLGYEAYNSQGYFIDMWYYSSWKELTIRLEVPTETEEIVWNEHQISTVLPDPLSTNGLFVRKMKK